jgi:hypothetical protein
MEPPTQRIRKGLVESWRPVTSSRQQRAGPYRQNGGRVSPSPFQQLTTGRYVAPDAFAGTSIAELQHYYRRLNNNSSPGRSLVCL